MSPKETASSRVPPIFDGHNDLLLRLQGRGPDAVDRAIEGDPAGHLDLPRMDLAGFAGGLFAIFVPSRKGPPWREGKRLGQAEALRASLSMAEDLKRIERRSKGALRQCHFAADIAACLNDGTIAAVLHMEGAEAIDENFEALEVLLDAGLRSIGPVWSRPNAFGHGVPFRSPASPDIGPGLSEPGRDLVRLCNRSHIAIDLAHMNAAGFRDVAALSEAPLIVSHGNVHHLSPHSRNLLDWQIDAVRESGGLIGITFACAYIRADGRMDPQTSLDALMGHVRYLLERAGPSCVAIGSDFDGAVIPAPIGDVMGLIPVRHALRDLGLDDDTMNDICYRNWVRILARTWGEPDPFSDRAGGRKEAKNQQRGR